jgi:hypothetical protein
MGKVSIFCIFLVLALLLEDGSSVRKRTEEEEKEDREIAEKVNATLAAEEAEKKKEEEDEAKRKRKVNVQSEEKDKDEKGKDRDEAGPTLNSTCPSVDPCPEIQECSPCPEERVCPEVQLCEPCPPVEPCLPCQPCRPCKPCGPCPKLNRTSMPDINDCPEPTEAGMSTAVAMAVGACASLLATCVAALIGIILRYVPPLVSGVLFLTTIIMVWFLSSHYPETARELGGRVMATLREASLALGHRIMAAIRHHDQVGFSLINLSLFFFMSSMFEE